MSAQPTTADLITPQQIARFRNDGFVKVSGVLTTEQAATFRQAAIDCTDRLRDAEQGRVANPFDQFVNVWRTDPAMRSLTLRENIGRIAGKLLGRPLRLWHDQTLIKQPRRSTPTQFHQDQPYWPHPQTGEAISCWIALGDVPVERGCMTFLPGSHQWSGLPMQNLQDERSLMSICPEMRWLERVTLPLRAGDCTFHHARCAHMANANVTDEARVAHVIIFMEQGTTFTGRGHVVTNPLGLREGDALDGPLFPTVDAFADLAAAPVTP